MPPLHPDAAAALRAPSLAAAAEAIAAMDAEWTAKADAAARLEQRCEELIAMADPGTDAFHGTGLAAKRRHQEALRNRQERWLEELGGAVEDDARSADEIPAYMEQARQQLVDLVVDGKWDEAIAMADSVGENAHLALLYIALGTDAPLEAILELIHRNGGVLPEESTWGFLHSRRQDLPAIADALEPFGLDVHYVDAVRAERIPYSCASGLGEGKHMAVRRISGRSPGTSQTERTGVGPAGHSADEAGRASAHGAGSDPIRALPDRSRGAGAVEPLAAGGVDRASRRGRLSPLAERRAGVGLLINGPAAHSTSWPPHYEHHRRYAGALPSLPPPALGLEITREL